MKSAEYLRKDVATLVERLNAVIRMEDAVYQRMKRRSAEYPRMDDATLVEPLMDAVERMEDAAYQRMRRRSLQDPRLTRLKGVVNILELTEDAIRSPGNELSGFVEGPHAARAIAVAEVRLATEMRVSFDGFRGPDTDRFKEGLPSSTEFFPSIQTFVESVFDAAAEERLARVDTKKSVWKYLEELTAVADQIVTVVCSEDGFWRRIVLTGAHEANFWIKETPYGEFSTENFLRPPSREPMRAALSLRMKHWEWKALCAAVALDSQAPSSDLRRDHSGVYVETRPESETPPATAEPKPEGSGGPVGVAATAEAKPEGSVSPVGVAAPAKAKPEGSGGPVGVAATAEAKPERMSRSVICPEQGRRLVRDFVTQPNMGMTEFAHRCKINGRTLRSALKGGPVLRETLRAIARGMGITFEELVKSY
jgi:hypothetical protein